MIQFVFGGQKGDREFDKWLAKTTFVYRFNPFQQGDLTRFSAAVQRSLETLTHVDYHGNVTGKVVANDPMLIHVPEELLEKAEDDWCRVSAFFTLAKDAGLDVAVGAYNNERAALLANELIK